jgi:hypothetical protein
MVNGTLRKSTIFYHKGNCIRCVQRPRGWRDGNTGTRSWPIGAPSNDTSIDATYIPRIVVIAARAFGPSHPHHPKIARKLRPWQLPKNRVVDARTARMDH